MINNYKKTIIIIIINKKETEKNNFTFFQIFHFNYKTTKTKRNKLKFTSKQN